MKVSCDPEVDTLRIWFRNQPIEKCNGDMPGVILDDDKDGTRTPAAFHRSPKGREGRAILGNPELWRCI